MASSKPFYFTRYDEDARRPVMRQSAATRYAVSIASAGAALLLRAAISPFAGARFPLVFAFLAVVFVAGFFGYGPGLAVAFISVLGGVVFFHDTHLMPDAESVGLGPFILSSLVIIGLTEALRRARIRAEEEHRRLGEESARRAREQAVSAQLRAIVESSDDAIVSIDLGGVIRSWNHAAERIFGYSAAEAIGHPIAILTPGDLTSAESEALDQIRRGDRVSSFETVRLHRSVAPIQVSVTVSPIYGAAGNLSGMSYIARDITERKAFEQRLLERQKLESLGVLAGGLAHDFNNLLTSIMGNASLVRDTVTMPALRERLDNVLRAGEHAALLVRQMLAYAGKGAFIISGLDLSREIQEMQPLIRAAVQRSVLVAYDLAPGLPLVNGDSSQFRQLVMNLVVNASEAIQDSGIVSISTRETADGANVTLEVRDTGCGMDAATKSRIFDPFFSTKFAGRGLGLPAVMGIVRASSGEILVESEPGRGSAFRVKLPAAHRDTAASQTT